MRAIRMSGAVLLAGGLGGCVPPLQELAYAAPPSAPLVVVPGPGKTEAAFRGDDAACQADMAQLPPGRAGQPGAAQLRAAEAPGQAAEGESGITLPEALPPGAAYLRCMTARGNQVQVLQTAAPPAYGYPAAYPVYAGAGYGYPFFYNDPFLLRSRGGFGYRGYGYRGFGFGRGFGRYGYGGHGGGRYPEHGFGGRFGGGHGRGEGGGHRGGFARGGFGRR